MKCPACVDEGKRSIIRTDGPGSLTAMFGDYYYDEDGNYHVHDPNITTTRLVCSRGHRLVHTSATACPVDNCEHSTRVEQLRVEKEDQGDG